MNCSSGTAALTCIRPMAREAKAPSPGRIRAFSIAPGHLAPACHKSQSNRPKRGDQVHSKIPEERVRQVPVAQRITAARHYPGSYYWLAAAALRLRCLKSFALQFACQRRPTLLTHTDFPSDLLLRYHLWTVMMEPYSSRGRTSLIRPWLKLVTIRFSSVRSNSLARVRRKWAGTLLLEYALRRAFGRGCFV
jgi:hypothetical protein